MLDREISVALHAIQTAATTINGDCDQVNQLFRALKRLFDQWGVGITAHFQEETGPRLEYRRFGKSNEWRFTVVRQSENDRVEISSLSRPEKLDIIHLLPPLLHNIHAKLTEQRASVTTVSDIVARLELLLDKDEDS